MSTHESSQLPYLQLSSPGDGIPTILTGAKETDPSLRAAYKRIGITRLVELTIDGGVRFTGKWCISKETPYTKALNSIHAAQLAGELPEGSQTQAIDMMVCGEFDGSSLAERYMPRQRSE